MDDFNREGLKFKIDDTSILSDIVVRTLNQNLLPTIFKVGKNKDAVETFTTVEIITERHLLDYLMEHFITYQSLNHQTH